MRGRSDLQRLNKLSRLGGVALLGSLAAACSSETMRFGDNPFSNPLKSSSAESDAAPSGGVATASAPTSAVRTSAVHSQPLGAPVTSQPLAAPKVASAPASSSHQPVTSSGGTAAWTASGGTSVTVGAGDSLATISNRYGVPANAILSANGLSNASQVTSGRQITIPVYSASGVQTAQSAPAPAASQVAASQAATPHGKLRFVEGPKPAAKAVASADEPKRHVRPGQAVAAKGGAAADAAPVKHAKADAAPVKQAKAESAPEPVKQAKAEAAPKPAEAPKVARLDAKPVETAKAAAPAAAPAPAPQAKQEVAKAPVKDAEQTGSLPAAAADPSGDFRWPAKGRVIAGFGANGGNEGINIAVPDGTPVKAAEAGTVTYAGSEVKGYGNLVLIKHDNGFVSAYAHNGSLDVKRGERVKRGQVVAKAGQTGNVTSPQLHFEIRKGQTPVDPVPHLSN